MYEYMLNVILELIPGFDPDWFISDFESGLIVAVAHVLPRARHRGCYFHLGQSLWRKISEVGHSVEYKTDISLRLFYKQLLALAFLPLHEVEGQFNRLMDDAPNAPAKVVLFYWR
jgi:hypothetical protein